MTKDFLEHIWPKAGLYCIAVPRKKPDGVSYYKQTVFTCIDDAVKAAIANDKANFDCFMAVGTLKELKRYNKKREKYEVRSHDNMDRFKTLIFDIDCGPRKPYSTQADALVALKKFVSKGCAALPVPTVVNSGGGLHVYFTLTEDISADTWHEYSLMLKAIAKYFELEVDDSRTSDKSSVLRVAGTHNHKQKNNPREVKVLKYGEPTTPEQMLIDLKRAINHYKITMVAPRQKIPEADSGVKNAFKDLRNNVYNPANSEKIFKRCNMMKNIRACGGDVGENAWRFGLMVDRLTDTPDPYALSTGSASYNESVMLAKLAPLVELDMGPARCDSFRALTEGPEADWCNNCPHDVKSPLILGLSPIELKPARVKLEKTVPVEVVPVKQLDEPTVESEEKEVVISDFFSMEDLSDEEAIEPSKMGVETDEDVEEPDEAEEDFEQDDNLDGGEQIITSFGPMTLPKPPYPYKRTTAGIYFEAEDGEDGSIGDTGVIYTNDIYPYRLLSETEGSVYTIGVRVKLPHEIDYKEFEMPLNAFVDGKSFNKMLADVGIIPPETKQSEMLLVYMKKYIAKIQDEIKAIPSYAQLGWAKDGDIFVLPEKTLLLNGEEEKSVVAKGISNSVQSFRKKGTLEGWRKVIDVYKRPGLEPHAFGHLVGYGSLLLNFTDYDGAIVNLVGGTGSGKTTILRTINSIFGHHKEPLLVHHDTYLAKINRLGVFRSICVTYDEITNIEAEELSNLCYSITQGRGKHRLNQNAEAKDNNTTWKLILASTSNKSLMGTLSLLKHDSAAESVRVFEYQVDNTNMFTKEQAGELFDDRLEQNFGHAGEPFIKHVMEHQDSVRKLIRTLGIKFDRAAEVSNTERYWSAVVSCSLAGGYIANKLGLADFDMDKLFDWCVNQVKVMRGVVDDNNTSPVSLLIEFMNNNFGSTLTLQGGKKGTKLFADEKMLPRNKIIIRQERDRGRAYIDRKVIGEWLKKGGADFTSVKKALLDSGVILNLNVSKVLSSDSDLPRTGQTKCWLIDLDHCDMDKQVSLSEVGSRPVEMPSAYDDNDTAIDNSGSR